MGRLEARRGILSQMKKNFNRTKTLLLKISRAVWDFMDFFGRGLKIWKKHARIRRMVKSLPEVAKEMVAISRARRGKQKTIFTI